MAYLLLTFSSTHAAMSAQKALQSHVPLTVMPALREIRATCGLSLRIEKADASLLFAHLGLLPADSFALYEIAHDCNGHITATQIQLPVKG